MTDLDDLIKNRHGDVKKLREIRDTIRHDNFITADAKKYIESLTLNHELSIYEQCKIGCRIFDIRIFYDKKNNIWYNSHTFITVKLDDIINDLTKLNIHWSAAYPGTGAAGI